jgi:hypothetical protein
LQQLFFQNYFCYHKKLKNHFPTKNH